MPGRTDIPVCLLCSQMPDRLESLSYFGFGGIVEHISLLGLQRALLSYKINAQDGTAGETELALYFCSCEKSISFREGFQVRLIRNAERSH